MEGMGRSAKTVCTHPREIDRLNRLITELPQGERVRVVENGGQMFSGTVVERPALQLFEDADGNEGFNAVLRLDDPSAPPWDADLWLSDILRVEPLDRRSE